MDLRNFALPQKSSNFPLDFRLSIIGQRPSFFLRVTRGQSGGKGRERKVLGVRRWLMRRARAEANAEGVAVSQANQQGARRV